MLTVNFHQSAFFSAFRMWIWTAGKKKKKQTRRQERKRCYDLSWQEENEFQVLPNSLSEEKGFCLLSPGWGTATKGGGCTKTTPVPRPSATCKSSQCWQQRVSENVLKDHHRLRRCSPALLPPGWPSGCPVIMGMVTQGPRGLQDSQEGRVGAAVHEEPRHSLCQESWE